MGLCSQDNTDNYQSRTLFQTERIIQGDRSGSKPADGGLPAVPRTLHTAAGTDVISSSQEANRDSEHWTHCIASTVSGRGPESPLLWSSMGTLVHPGAGRPQWFMFKTGKSHSHFHSSDTALAPLLNRLHYKPVASGNGLFKTSGLN